MTETVNTLAFVNRKDGSHVEYEGPFEADVDSRVFQVVIPVDPDDYAGIHEGTAENLTDREDDLAVVTKDGSVEVTGIINACNIIDGELLVAIYDGNTVEPTTIDRNELGL